MTRELPVIQAIGGQARQGDAPQEGDSSSRGRAGGIDSVGRGSVRRTFHPGSLPQHMAVTVVDLDVTKNCNLRCGYCFKSDTVYPGGSRMSLETAMAAMDWLIAASYSANELWVNLFGGEPLLEFGLIQRLVPYGKRRAAAFGKTIQFGCTTNLTLVDEEVATFFRQWGMGWHCSIDGPPEVQDRQRPGAGGARSSERAERGVSWVLKDRPGAMARATVTPATVGCMYRSLLYFEGLGFINMGFAPADETEWTDTDLAEYDRQTGLIREHARDEWYRKGVDREYGAFDYIIRAQIAGEQQQHQCGAGRGTVLVDEHGDLWPCHRWDGADRDSGGGKAWRFGNIFEDGYNHALHLALLDKDRWACFQPKCSSCPANRLCAGGCAAANLVHCGSVYEQHRTSCEASRIAFKHAMLLHDELKTEKNELLMRKFYGGVHPRLNSYSPASESAARS